MPTTYIVKAGDTLERIAQRECGDKSLVAQIAADNNLANASRIWIGQQLTLPCGEEVASDPPVAVASAATSSSTLPEIRARLDEVSRAPSTSAPPVAQPASLTETPIITPATIPAEIFVKVPYHSQEDQDAKWAAADCGPTCVRMLLGWKAVQAGLTDPELSVDEVSQATGMGRKKFSQFKQLVAAAEKYGLLLEYSKEATAERIFQELDAGRPVIALVNYGKLTKRQNQKFRAGHFVVVVGYNETDVILNDPDWWGLHRADGAGFRVPRKEFETAIGFQASLEVGNNPHQALFIKLDA